MTQEMYVLPVQCRGCGNVFDLYYDLQQDEEATKLNSEGGAVINKTLKQSLCHGCRKDVAFELHRRINMEHDVSVMKDSDYNLEFD